MSFGRAFDAFVGGLESGLKSGNQMQDEQLRRQPAKEKADLDRNVTLQPASVQGLGTLRGKLQTNSGADEAIPTAPADMGDGERGYAQGGYVDPVEQDNGSYYREEAARTQQAAPQEAVPTAPSNPPTPPARPGGNTDTIPTDEHGNIIQQTIEAVKNMPGNTQNTGAIPDGQPAQGPAHPIQDMVDLSGKSYPDLTQTIGGIRQVTGAPADRPLTTADHIDFLQRRVQYAAQHGYDMNEVLKFNVQYLDNLRFQASRTFALASAAWDAGDGAAVQKFVQQGYGLVPDGLGAKTSFKDGNLIVQPYDEKTGKPTGQPLTMNKQQFMQKAQSITGDPISWGQALENTPYTTGTTRGAGSGRGRGRYRTSDAGTTTDDGTGTTAVKPMPTTFGSQLTRALGGKNADPVAQQRGEKLYTMLPPDQRTPANVAALAKRLDPNTGDLVAKTDGLYTKDGQKVTSLNIPKGVTPVPSNKVADAAATPAPAAPADPAAPAAPKGIGATKSGPGAVSATPPTSPGSAQAKPAPAGTQEAIPTDAPPQRSTFDRLRGMGKEVGGVVKDKLGMTPPDSSTSGAEAGNASSDQEARVAEWTQKLETAKANQAPAHVLATIQARLDMERGKK